MTAYEFWRKRLQERDDDAVKMRDWTADQLSTALEFAERYEYEERTSRGKQ